MLTAAIFALLVLGVSVTEAAPRAARDERRLAERSEIEPADRSEIEPADRLIGGEEIDDFSEWPFYCTLSIEYNGGWGRFYCPGLVYNERTLITTAQCTEAFQDSGWLNVSTKTADCGDNIGVEVESVLTHDKYDGQSAVYNKTFLPNDIGLMRLKDDLVIDDTCDFVNLPEQGEVTQPQTVTVIGYSTDDHPYYEDRDDRRKVELDILPEGECSAHAGNYYNPDMHICLQDPNQEQGACFSDHSSPAILHGDDQKVVALGSWIYTMCAWNDYPWSYFRFYRPAYYTRLAHYINWICEKAYGSSACSN